MSLKVIITSSLPLPAQDAQDVHVSGHQVAAGRVMVKPMAMALLVLLLVVLSALLVDHFVAEGVPVAVVKGVPVPLLMVTMMMMMLLLLISMVELMLVVVVLMVRVALLLVVLKFYNFSQLE